MSGRPRLAARGKATRPVLVTGGAGFLGTNLADRLAGAGRGVIVFDSLERKGVVDNLEWLAERHGRAVSVVVGDVRDRGLVEAVVAEAGAVLHLAAQVAVTTSVADPRHDFEVNAAGTLNVLEAARRCKAPPPVLFASTNKVYGKLAAEAALRRTGRRWEPDPATAATGVGERAPLDFLSPYGCSKGVADQYVLDYARVYGLETLVFRMSCLYGQHQRGNEDQGWVAHFMMRARDGLPVTVYGDGAQVRDALDVADACDAWLAGLEQVDRLRGRVFNLGGGPRNAVSLLEMLDRLGHLYGRVPEVEWGPWRAGDQRWYVSDTRTLEEATGWRARTPLEVGLLRLKAWLDGRARPALELPLPEGAAA